jgi:hypothetical protein
VVTLSLTHDRDQSALTTGRGLKRGLQLPQLTLAANKRRPMEGQSLVAQSVFGVLAGTPWPYVRTHGL